VKDCGEGAQFWRYGVNPCDDPLNGGDDLKQVRDSAGKDARGRGQRGRRKDERGAAEENDLDEREKTCGDRVKHFGLRVKSCGDRDQFLSNRKKFPGDRGQFPGNCQQFRRDRKKFCGHQVPHFDHFARRCDDLERACGSSGKRWGDDDEGGWSDEGRWACYNDHWADGTNLEATENNAAT
jgi:hypothetical protein